MSQFALKFQTLHKMQLVECLARVVRAGVLFIFGVEQNPLGGHVGALNVRFLNRASQFEIHDVIVRCPKD